MHRWGTCWAPTFPALYLCPAAPLLAEGWTSFHCHVSTAESITCTWAHESTLCCPRANKDKAAAQPHLLPLASGIVAARPFFRHGGIQGLEGSTGLEGRGEIKWESANSNHFRTCEVKLDFNETATKVRCSLEAFRLLGILPWWLRDLRSCYYVQYPLSHLYGVFTKWLMDWQVDACFSVGPVTWCRLVCCLAHVCCVCMSFTHTQSPYVRHTARVSVGVVGGCGLWTKYRW